MSAAGATPRCAPAVIYAGHARLAAAAWRRHFSGSNLLPPFCGAARLAEGPSNHPANPTIRMADGREYHFVPVR